MPSSRATSCMRFARLKVNNWEPWKFAPIKTSKLAITRRTRAKVLPLRAMALSNLFNKFNDNNLRVDKQLRAMSLSWVLPMLLVFLFSSLNMPLENASVANGWQQSEHETQKSAYLLPSPERIDLQWNRFKLTMTNNPFVTTSSSRCQGVSASNETNAAGVGKCIYKSNVKHLEPAKVVVVPI